MSHHAGLSATADIPWLAYPEWIRQRPAPKGGWARDALGQSGLGWPDAFVRPRSHGRSIAGQRPPPFGKERQVKSSARATYAS